MMQGIACIEFFFLSTLQNGRQKTWSIDLIERHKGTNNKKQKANKQPLFSCLIFIERHRDLKVRTLDSASYIV